MDALCRLIEAEPAANTDITDEGAAAQKSAWLWGLEALAAESCPERAARLWRAASRRARHPRIDDLLALPAEFFDLTFGCTVRRSGGRVGGRGRGAPPFCMCRGATLPRCHAAFGELTAMPPFLLDRRASRWRTASSTR
jgi:hypothetical protein